MNHSDPRQPRVLLVQSVARPSPGQERRASPAAGRTSSAGPCRGLVRRLVGPPSPCSARLPVVGDALTAAAGLPRTPLVAVPYSEGLARGGALRPDRGRGRGAADRPRGAVPECPTGRAAASVPTGRQSGAIDHNRLSVPIRWSGRASGRLPCCSCHRPTGSDPARAGRREDGSRPGRYQSMPSSRRASSDIIEGFQGGSQTIATSQAATPSTAATLSRTSAGRLSATGQCGEVKVISTRT